MSEPKRYDFFLKAYTKQFVDVTGARYVYPDAGMTENIEGKYVEYSDYARLEKDFHQAHDERADYAKDVSKLKAEVDALKLGSLLTAVDVLQFIKLKEENERLRKAGDEMANRLTNPDRGKSYFYPVLHDALCAWTAAKEGKQP